MKVKRILNKNLGSFKKNRLKEKSLESLGLDDNGIYLIIQKRSSLTNNIFKIKAEEHIFLQRPFNNGGSKSPVVFLEVMKYLVKYRNLLRARNVNYDADVKAKIKTHLIQHFQKRMSENKAPYVASSNIRLLNGYASFIDNCFEIFNADSGIKLVIQKKVGYKYYERMTYY